MLLGAGLALPLGLGIFLSDLNTLTEHYVSVMRYTEKQDPFIISSSTDKNEVTVQITKVSNGPRLQLK